MERILVALEREFQTIPTGRFMMGSPDEEAGLDRTEGQHWLDVRDFRLLRTPVTFAVYDAYCEIAGIESPDDAGWGRRDRPVINVAYWDAVGFCEWLTKTTGTVHRLPTEAEWEYSCRAATKTTFWMGNSIGADQANFDARNDQGGSDTFRRSTTPVKQFPPNPWGPYDTHGNVWEWCASEYDEQYCECETQDASNNQRNDVLRVLRGGSWLHPSADLRSASRHWDYPTSRHNFYGVRIAQDV